jgi:hypothetical protein
LGSDYDEEDGNSGASDDDDDTDAIYVGLPGRNKGNTLEKNTRAKAS